MINSSYLSAQSGLSTRYSVENERKWNEFIDQAYRSGEWAKLKRSVSEHLVEKGLAPLPDDLYMCVETSPFLVGSFIFFWLPCLKECP